MYDYRHRDYDPVLGRFLQRDPLEYIDSLNAYAYVANNPINFVDPYGLERAGGNGNVGPGRPGGWNLGTRIGGVVQAAGSAAGLIGIGAATGVSGPIGAAIAITSGAKLFDSFITGLQTAATGQSHDSTTSKLLQQAGVSPTIANIIDTGLDVVAGVGAARTAITTASSGRVFWSGGVDARNAAEAFSKTSGGKTLEMTLPGKVLDILTTKQTYPYLKPLWEKASANFARGAEGTVDVFQSSRGVRLESIWSTQEYPQLVEQSTEIIFHVVP